MASKDDERVLCVPTAEVDKLGHFQGFHADAERYLAFLLRPGTARFVRRGECETDPSLKQIIPYVNDDSTPVGKVHLGVVHSYHLEAPVVHPREEGLAEAGFISFDKARELKAEFETWSQIVLDHLFQEGQ